MLLQAVDSIQLLQNSGGSSQLGDISAIGEYSLADSSDLSDANLLSQYTPSRQIQAVLNSPLPEGLAEFSTLHSSKDFVLYGTESETDDSPMAQTSNSPLPTSPLSYPTPPASHEGITQSSPYLDDTHHFGDANSIFDDKKSISFLDENGLFKDIKPSRLSDCEQILKLKHELFNDSKIVMDETMYFKSEIKSEYDSKVSVDMAETNNHTDNIDEFNQNLSFLDESRNFLEDSRNPSSPLSAAFFTGTMSSAEEVKEALQEVLPNESIACEQNTDIDLYYLPSAAFQSQMMLNSDDPLLSSSPKDFILKHPINRFEFDSCSSAKKPKLDAGAVNAEKAKILITNQAEKISNETFLSPSNLPLSTQPTSAATNNAQAMVEFSSPVTKDSTQCMGKHSAANLRRNIAYKSILRRASAPYYTPAPMLDPKRSAAGLYAEISKDPPDDLIDFEFAENACVPEFTRKLKVNIGSDFQAIIPSTEAKSANDGNTETPYEQQMWHSNVLQNDKKIQRFVELAKSSAIPLGCHSEETALKALQDANGEIPNAILRLLQEPSSSIHNRWQPHEVETFLNALEQYGKNFYKISKEVSTFSSIFFFFLFSFVLCSFLLDKNEFSGGILYIVELFYFIRFRFDRKQRPIACNSITFGKNFASNTKALI